MKIKAAKVIRVPNRSPVSNRVASARTSTPASRSGTTWGTGLLSTYEIKDPINLANFRVLEIGSLLDNGN